MTWLVNKLAGQVNIAMEWEQMFSLLSFLRNFGHEDVQLQLFLLFLLLFGLHRFPNQILDLLVLLGLFHFLTGTGLALARDLQHTHTKHSWSIKVREKTKRKCHSSQRVSSLFTEVPRPRADLVSGGCCLNFRCSSRCRNEARDPIPIKWLWPQDDGRQISVCRRVHNKVETSPRAGILKKKKDYKSYTCLLLACFETRVWGIAVLVAGRVVLIRGTVTVIRRNRANWPRQSLVAGCRERVRILVTCNAISASLCGDS